MAHNTHHLHDTLMRALEDPSMQARSRRYRIEQEIRDAKEVLAHNFPMRNRNMFCRITCRTSITNIRYLRNLNA